MLKVICFALYILPYINTFLGVVELAVLRNITGGQEDVLQTINGTILEVVND